MTIIELLLLSVSLCFDTFAVSISGGLSLKNIKFSKKAMIMAFFGFVQSGLLFIGYIGGAAFDKYINRWDHWIAFAILLYIGGKMVLENLPDRWFNRSAGGKDAAMDGEVENCCCTESGINLLNFKTLLTLAVATSIDAIAVGISLAFVELSFVKIGITTLLTFMTTATASFIGLAGGQKLGCKIGSQASLIGGIVLVLIGIKIVAEHIL